MIVQRKTIANTAMYADSVTAAEKMAETAAYVATGFSNYSLY